MPFLVASVMATNEKFGPLEGFDPAQILSDMDGAENLVQAGEMLHLFNGLPPEHADDLKRFLHHLPQSIDAAILAGVRDALSRQLRSQLTWQPGYDFELRMWEVSDAAVGLVNFLLITPHPEESVLS